MTQWQYLVLRIGVGEPKFEDIVVDGEDRDEGMKAIKGKSWLGAMVALGKLGWEAIQISYHAYHPSAPEHVYFKRPVHNKKKKV